MWRRKNARAMGPPFICRCMPPTLLPSSNAPQGTSAIDGWRRFHSGVRLLQLAVRTYSLLPNGVPDYADCLLGGLIPQRDRTAKKPYAHKGKQGGNPDRVLN